MATSGPPAWDPPLGGNQRTTTPRAPFGKVPNQIGLCDDNKKNACIFCMQKKAWLWRHQKTVHRSEREVKEIVSSSDSDEVKAQKVSLLRNRGNFEYNKLVVQRGHGNIIVGRKSTTFSASDYVPCPNCLLYLVKWDMKAHLTNSCAVGRDQEISNAGMDAIMMKCLEMRDGPAPESSDFVANVLLRMHEDEIREIITKDNLLFRFGSNLYEKLGRGGYQQISQRLRALGVLLKETGSTMSDLIQAGRFEEVVKGTQRVCGYDKDRVNPHTDLPTYKTPSKAMKLGGDLRQIAALKKAVGLEAKDEEMVSDSDSFLYMLETYWNVRVSSVALKTKDAEKYEKKDLLPFTSDLKTFTENIKAKIGRLTEKGVTSQSDYVCLSKAVIARLLVFNKRRPKELEKVLLSSWLQRDLYKRETVEEVNSSMGVAERQMFEKLDVVMARGKCGNKIPILIPEESKAAIQLLLDVRNEYVDGNNKFLFANPLARKSGHFSAGVILKGELQGMTLRCPELFMATKLRKYCASTSQILEMGDLDMEILTRHMGHDKEVHRTYYRKSDATHELTRAAILMMKLDDGNLSKYAGLSLDNILELGKLHQLVMFTEV